MGTNNEGQKPFQRYGALMPIAETPPATGNALTIWGYGIDSPCNLSQTQQTSDGSVTSVSGTLFNHNVDATFGNSGSGLIRNGQEILGIATHCPCPNWATRVDHPAFTAARESLCPTAAPQAATLVSATVVQGSLIGGGLAELGNSDNQHYAVASVLAGVRHNVIVDVAAQSPTPTVEDLSFRVEFGAANASPVFYALQIFNDDQSVWENVKFGVVSTGGDTVVDSGPIPSPSAHVSASGQIRVRLVQTARSVQVPSGFTALVDQVLVTVVAN
jgi:hypothetical protein